MKKYIINVCTAILLLIGSLSSIAATVSSSNTQTNEPSSKPLVWMDSFGDALTSSSHSFKPIMIVFSSPHCPWCTRYKNDTLTAPDVIRCLHFYTLVSIDVTDQPETAQQFQIQGVPTTVILYSDGRVNKTLSGYIPPENLSPILSAQLNPKITSQFDANSRKLLNQITSGSIASNQWPNIMLALGNKNLHNDFWDALMSMPDIPSTNLVNLLAEPLLAVRLGAIDILEEISGNTFDYDPWISPTNVRNRIPLQKWQSWAEGKSGKIKTSYITIAPDKLERLLQQVVGNDIYKSRRAIRVLQTAGPSVTVAIDAFISKHPELPQGAVLRIKEIQYALWLPDLKGSDSYTLAHQLTFGTLDMKLDAIRKLGFGSKKTLPILRDFLSSPDAIVRETTIESILSVAGAGAIPLISEHLKTEQDVDVLYATLRTLGSIRSKRGLKLISEYANHKNEDIAAIALTSLGKLKSKLAVDVIIKDIHDPRWRVRVAAIEAAGNLQFNELQPAVTAALNDDDSFVKHTAIKSLTRINGSKTNVIEKLKMMLTDNQIDRAVIIESLTSLNETLPPSMKNILKTESPDNLVAIIDAMQECQQSDLNLIINLVHHKNNDVSCSAIRLLATKGFKNTKTRQLILKIMKTGNTEQQRVAMEAVTKNLIHDKMQARFNLTPTIAVSDTAISLADILPGSASNTSTNMLDDLIAAFEPRKTPAPTTDNNQHISLDDLIAAFEPKDRHPDKTATQKEFSTVKIVQTLLDKTDDQATAFDAAIFMLLSDNTNVIPRIAGDIKTYNQQQREQLAESLTYTSSEAFNPILKTLLNDPAEDIRKAAARGIIRDLENPARIAILFDTLDAANTLLRPYECDFTNISCPENKKTKNIIVNWCTANLSPTNKPDRIIESLIIANSCWKKKYITSITNLCSNTNQWIRRSALNCIANHDKTLFKKLTDTIANDSSEFVRIVIPSAYSSSSRSWKYFFDKVRYQSSWQRCYSSRSAKLPKDVIKVLHKLTSDPSPRVQVSSFNTLMAHHEPFDINNFKATIDKLPDNDTELRNLGVFLASNYRKLGPEFAELLPYLKKARISDSTLKKIYKHFNMKEDDEQNISFAFITPTNTAPAIASFINTTNAPAVTQKTAKITLVFFASPGCTACDHVDKLLSRIQNSFTNLVIHKYSIRKNNSMILNEALCENFNVPTKLHLVTPAIFGAAGAIIKHEISAPSISTLIANSAGYDDEQWLNLRNDALENAQHTITQRSKNTSIFFIIFAGFLDGINPCAFATIIFFLSYLQVTKRSPTEIMQIGIAFILGVFLAYFSLGLGMREIVTRITIFQKLSNIIDWLIAGFAFSIAIISIRDGILCLRGRMADMTLQLPSSLKTQIHSVIRKGSRQRRFIIAAFIIGIIISFLELACTGQVYLPTILYVLNTSPDKTLAITMLLVYNVAFIIPLTIIFGFAYSGIRSQTFITFMQKHAAIVKFITAAFFFILFILFVF